MKILFIHNQYLQSAGGEDTTLDAEAGLLASNGHEVHIELFNNSEMGKGPIHKLRAGISSIYNGRSAKKVKNIIRDFKPDIVHVHNFYFTATPSVVIEANRQHIPVVMTIQNYRLICANCLLLRDNKVCELCVNHDFPWYGVKYKCYHDSAIQSAMVGAIAAIHKWIGTWRNRVDIYITPAAFSRDKLINSSLKLLPEKTRVKRNFITDPEIGEAKNRSNYFLFIGRLSAEKGVHVLLDAMATLPNFHLIVAGDGPDAPALIEKYGHLKNVEFVGKKSRPDVLTLMKNCRALVFPSIWYEGLPLTIVEAFATGTPVIASDLGAMTEMIRHNNNGLLFQSGNSIALTKAMNDFYTSVESGNQSFYQFARESYMELYHPEKCYKAIMEIYHEVIQSKTNPAKN